jgi:AraC family transcriptional regulator
MLYRTKARESDIALDFGFSTHETFTRAFKDAFGMTPEEYRADPVRLNNFVKPAVITKLHADRLKCPLGRRWHCSRNTRQSISLPQYFIGLNGGRTD